MALKLLSRTTRGILYNSRTFRVFSTSKTPVTLIKSYPVPQHYKFLSTAEGGGQGAECSGDEKKKRPKPYRHNYSEEVEGAVNNQILAELNASMTYLSLSVYYGRVDICLPGCQGFFKSLYLEEQEHAMDFINYQLMRGGRVTLYPITVPEDQEWVDITIALAVALEMEKRVKEKLECLFEIADTHGDLQLVDIVSTKYIKAQVIILIFMRFKFFLGGFRMNLYGNWGVF